MTININKPEIDLRDTINRLDKPTGIAGHSLLRANTYQEQQALLGVGRRNFFINGAFNISQRNTSFTNPTTDEYMLDGWFQGSTGSNYTTSQGTATLPTGEEVKTFRTDWTGSTTEWYDPYQGIEDYKMISGQFVTFSCWARCNKSVFGFRQYSTGNIGDRFIGDGEWRYYTFTTRLGNITNGLTRGANSAFFGITSDTSRSFVSGDYIEFTQVQLELGQTATPFERLNPQQDLALCQRYYYIIGNKTGTSNDTSVAVVTYYQDYDVRGHIEFPVQMYKVPTAQAAAVTNGYRIITNAGVQDYMGDLYFAKMSKDSAHLYNTTEGNGSAGNSGYLFLESNSAWIEFEAKL